MKLLYEHDIIKEKNSSARCLKCPKLSFLSLTPNCKTIRCIYRKQIYMANSLLTSLTQLMITYDMISQRSHMLMQKRPLFLLLKCICFS